jgi:hypothetical protein
MFTAIVRAGLIAFWILAHGMLVFFVPGVGVFAWMRGENRLVIALLAVAVLMLFAFLVYSIRIRFRYAHDWKDLPPRRIGARVFSLPFGGSHTNTPNSE